MSELAVERKVEILRYAASIVDERHPKPYITFPNVAQHFATTVDQVQGLLTKHGWPRPASMRKAADIIEQNGNPVMNVQIGQTPPVTIPAAPPVKPDELDEATVFMRLMSRGRDHSAATIRAQAGRVEQHLKRLSDLLAADEAKHAEARRAKAAKEKLRAEIAQREAEIKALKAKLRGGAPKPTVAGEHACSHPGCDRTFPTPQGRSLHERRTHAGGDQ